MSTNRKSIQTRRILSEIKNGVIHQRLSPGGRPWSRGRPRGHTLKPLALASRVKSLALASKPQVLENSPVFGSRTELVFEPLKVCSSAEKKLKAFYFLGTPAPVSLVLDFGLEHSCPWSQKVSLRKGNPQSWPWPRIFFLCSWPQVLCPLLHLCYPLLLKN